MPGDWAEMVAEMTEYDPDGTAIIWQKPIKKSPPTPVPEESSVAVS